MYPHGYLDIKVLINPCHALQKASVFGCSLPRCQALRVTTAIGPISSPQVSCAEQPAPAGPKFCMTLKADTCPVSLLRGRVEASQTEKLQQQNENGTRTRGRGCLVLRGCYFVAEINNCTMFLRNISSRSTEYCRRSHIQILKLIH